MKNAFDRLINRLDTTQERISKLEETKTEISKIEIQREIMKKTTEYPRTMGTTYV